jgi:hypothetical protein
LVFLSTLSSTVPDKAILQLSAVATGDMSAGVKFAREGLVVARAIAEPHLRAFAVHALAIAEQGQSHWEATATLFREELAIWREIGDSRSIAFILMQLGRATHALGDPVQARIGVEEAADIFRDIGEYTWQATINPYLGLFAGAEGRFAEAARQYHASLRGYTGAGETLYPLGSLVGLAATAVEADRPESAARLLGAVDAQLRRGSTALLMSGSRRAPA